jgi:hypothetical protein
MMAMVYLLIAIELSTHQFFMAQGIGVSGMLDREK